ncbi:type I phosphomannose isomerase catalytic subunit [Oceanivirga miroungae]|uniref:Phosphohexomutase n=1 Tax=Oceanivirga miroungae TaxID=1130046 RepID=A0A6I8M8Q0_9FUSO|nr:type I phosphomannose isomerase catalytic subunit [Oceanivirga miroungae]VWL85195.1 mannose-6-phosphate isomerase [Oceanivirga miroungae]
MSNKLIFLTPFMREIIWGGDKIKKEFMYETKSDKIGEAWIVSANENGMSYVKDGEFKGLSLKELYEKNKNLFGNTTTKDFPLLVKYIDAKDDLSVQVHPDDNYARKVEGPTFNGKSEAWYILETEKDTQIEIGHNAKSKEELRKLVEEKKWDELLSFRDVKKGDFFDIAPGTVHAIKKGTLLLEVQQNSDITYRFYDYDRMQNGKLRELHIDKSIDVTNCPHVEDNSTRKKYEDYELLVDNPYFKMKKYEVNDKVRIENTENFVIIAVLSGEGKINETIIKKGDNFIIPYGYKDIEFTGKLEFMYIVSNK